jgi:hypothetical protein
VPSLFYRHDFTLCDRLSALPYRLSAYQDGIVFWNSFFFKKNETFLPCVITISIFPFLYLSLVQIDLTLSSQAKILDSIASSWTDKKTHKDIFMNAECFEKLQTTTLSKPSSHLGYLWRPIKGGLVLKQPIFRPQAVCRRVINNITTGFQRNHSQNEFSGKRTLSTSRARCCFPGCGVQASYGNLVDIVDSNFSSGLSKRNETNKRNEKKFCRLSSTTL